MAFAIGKLQSYVILSLVCNHTKISTMQIYLHEASKLALPNIYYRWPFDPYMCVTDFILHIQWWITIYCAESDLTQTANLIVDIINWLNSFV